MENQSTGISKIAIEFIMVAIFLGIALRVVHLRNTYAEAYSKRQDTEVALNNTLKYGKYTGNKTHDEKEYTVTGDIVLEALRNYHRGELVIYVDKDKNGAPIRQDASTLAIDSKKPFDLREYTVAGLTQRLDLTAEYYPYIVYDNAAIETEYGNTGVEITGIAFIRK